VKALKITVVSMLFFSSTFAMASLLFFFGDWHEFALVTLVGLCFGGIAAPSIDRDAFEKPFLYEISFGAGAGGLIGFLINSDQLAVGFGFILGALLGFALPRLFKKTKVS